jgi:uncharacterized protein YdaU (DUF1376 family)
MADFPALPLWTDSYLADTLDLTQGEHGIYLIMLMLAWRRPDCALPDDMAWLKRSLQSCCRGLHGHTFNAIVPKILDRFWFKEDGKWCQKRLQKERKYLSNRSEKNRKAAAARWEINNLTDANGMPAGNAPTPTPNPIGIDRQKDASNGMGKRDSKPKHLQRTRDGKRFWLDRGTSEWDAYLDDFRKARGREPPTAWNGSGAWFNVNGEVT